MSVLGGPWLARRAAASDDCEALSSSASLSSGDEGGAWIPCAPPPVTALSLLVDAGVLPDPFFGCNAPPDVFDVGRGFYTFLFATRFPTPLEPARRFSLLFTGANYRLAGWLNGVKLSFDVSSCGAYLPKRSAVNLRPNGAHNTLLLRVEPPDHPGCVVFRGQGGDTQIGRDVTMQATAGWDWGIPVADRNTGLTGDVVLEHTGAVAVRDVHVVPRVSVSERGGCDSAAVCVRATLVNVCHEPVDVTLSLEIEHPRCAGGRAPPAQSCAPVRLTLDAHETRVVEVTSGVDIPNPQLWWPIGCVAPRDCSDASPFPPHQPLYTAAVSARCGGMLSDGRRTRFGLRSLSIPIRELPCTDDAARPPRRGRVFVVNGAQLFVRGANWIASDLLLRKWAANAPGVNKTQEEVALLASAGVNVLRVWGGFGAPPGDDLYDACDEAGILVWTDFWITGDCDGRGAPPVDPSSASWPEDHALFLACAAAAVRRLRSRPCAALYCGGNEQTPPADIDAALARMLRADGKQPSSRNRDGGSSSAEGECLDDTRLYVRGSLWDGFGAGDGSFSGDGACRAPALTPCPPPPPSSIRCFPLRRRRRAVHLPAPPGFLRPGFLSLCF